MKNSITMMAILGTFLMSAPELNAQGLLGKLKDKVGQVAAGGGKAGEYFLPSEKEAKKDLETTTLEKMDFSADKTGISGVYISQKDIGYYGDDGARRVPIKSIKKFAVQLSASGKSMTITSNLVKDGVKPLLIRTTFGGDNHEKLEAAMLQKKLYFQYSSDGTDYDMKASKLNYIDQAFQYGKDEPWPFDFKQNFTVLEPGVIVMHEYARMEDDKRCLKPIFNNNDSNFYKNMPFNLLYKEGQDISKWTKQAIQDKLFELAKIYCQGVKSTGENNTAMPAKVTGFIGEASNAALLKAAQNRAKSKKWQESVISVYPTNKWSNIVKPLGINQVPTLVGRAHLIIAVLKDESGCYIMPMEVRQDNIYTVGSMAENYVGKEVYAWGNSSATPIDCAKTK